VHLDSVAEELLILLFQTAICPADSVGGGRRWTIQPYANIPRVSFLIFTVAHRYRRHLIALL